MLRATFIAGDRAEDRAFAVERLVIAGWTGRDPVAVEKHIRELEDLGVKRPASTPVFYRAAAARVTQAARIEASGNASSGEAEFVLLQWDKRLWVGAGSDHTDREVETYNVTVSKQMCEKPIAGTFWAFDELEAHWDQLILRAHIIENGARVLYQEGAVADMFAPPDLVARRGETLAEGTMMFCGTLAAKGGIRPSPRFEFALHDPVRARTIAHAYDVETLPMLG